MSRPVSKKNIDYNTMELEGQTSAFESTLTEKVKIDIS